jgi:hypothetical protein
MSNHIIIYSHGFGVKHDDRGLFTDIAAALPDVEHVMFDYNKIDDANNTLTAVPFDKQAQMLTDVVKAVKRKNPTAIVDLICHSQGCISAALAGGGLNARRTIFLAPANRVFDTDSEIFIKYPATTDKDGTMFWPRRDGSTTIIGQDYWQNSRQIGDIYDLYNGLVRLTKLSIMGAGQDEILGVVDYSSLDKNIEISVIEKADHNFKGESRAEMIKQIKEFLI